MHVTSATIGNICGIAGFLGIMAAGIWVVGSEMLDARKAKKNKQKDDLEKADFEAWHADAIKFRKLDV